MTYKSQTVSAIIITHNNAATLEKALASVHWVDELIIFDCGSTDQTLGIARAFTDKVFFHPSKNKTIVLRDALSCGKSDWLLLLEPVEWVEEMLRHAIEGALLNVPANLHGYTIPRQMKLENQWMGMTVGEAPSKLLRLVRQHKWAVSTDWDATLRVDGEIGKLERLIGATPYRNIDALFKEVSQQSTMAAYRQLETHGFSKTKQSTLSILFQLKLAALNYFIWKGGLFRGSAGFLLAMANTVQVFMKLAKIRSLTQKIQPQKA